MDEAHRGCVSCRQHRCFSHTIQTSGGRGKTTVRHVRGVPLVDVVVTGVPVDAILLRHQLVHLFDPRALNAAQLIDATALGRFFVKTQFVHLTYHFKPQGFIERELSLIEQAVRTCAARLARGIDRTPASPTQTSNVPTLAASAAAAWETRVPGSSMRQATPPTGM